MLSKNEFGKEAILQSRQLRLPSKLIISRRKMSLGRTSRSDSTPGVHLPIGGDAEVRLMTQQNWPMEYTICGLASRDETDEQIEDDGDEEGVP